MTTRGRGVIEVPAEIETQTPFTPAIQISQPPSPPPEPSDPTTGGTSYNSSTGVFDVRKFAWDIACLFESGVLLVPFSYSFMIQSTIFTGPCQSGFVFQVDGTLMPPDGPDLWPDSNSKNQWLIFYRINEISLQGGGLIDGRGKKWWDLPCKPYKGANRTTLSGPCDSPIVSDDCVSIGSGYYDVDIRNLTCGLGHGISIGSLGNHNTRACVSNVTVRDTVIKQSDNGVRIKTWQGGHGAVSGIMFSNVHMENVRNPIMIDQFYCLSKDCSNQTTAVFVSDIIYMNIKGTYDI
ncbi:hypothetical protein CsSME_00039785 [Camellia sinensis var. sinensis]